MKNERLLRCEHICKSFGPTKALSDVSLTVNRGEIRGLIGENGSGKSTISSIVAGVQAYDSGSMQFMGQPYKPRNMLAAQEAGISMVVQEAGTIRDMTVAANIFVGKERLFTRGIYLNEKHMFREARLILDEIGAFHIDEKVNVMELGFEDRKIVEIARAMYNRPQILIIDESTTALSLKGRDLIYNIMKRMSEEGKAVLFISHDLDELMSICNAITVLRDGLMIATMEQKDMNVHDMRTYMVGREISDDYFRSDYDGSCEDEVVLKVQNITCGRQIENVSFQLHKGEILGIGGLSDSGMHDVGRAVFGIEKLATGRIVLEDGSEIKSPETAIRKKIGYVSKNRDTEALILNDSIKNNIVLPSVPQLEYGFTVSPKKTEQLAAKQVEEMMIKCFSSEQNVQELSGGNKQKVVFAKWLGNGSQILILDCPTRGIDIGVKSYMYQLMYRLKKEGKSILMISEELPELVGMSDRILIIKDGVISGAFERDESLREADIIHSMI